MKADTEVPDRLYDAAPQEIASIYDRWAETYDTDLTEDSDYVAPEKYLDIPEKYAPARDARVLDVGASTGLFGQRLHGRGYRNITGIDISEGMLVEAGKKGVYVALRREVLGSPLAFPSDAFDAAIAVGVFSPGQGPPEAFEELIRITRPGGYVIFTLRPEFHEDSQCGFDQNGHVAWHRPADEKRTRGWISEAHPPLLSSLPQLWAVGLLFHSNNGRSKKPESSLVPLVPKLGLGTPFPEAPASYPITLRLPLPTNLDQSRLPRIIPGAGITPMLRSIHIASHHRIIVDTESETSFSAHRYPREYRSNFRGF